MWSLVLATALEIGVPCGYVFSGVDVFAGISMVLKTTTDSGSYMVFNAYIPSPIYMCERTMSYT